ncbi:MAG: MMPL family transporter [Lachnospiraceae bacterium]|nr:MMPL family transporter [Lachnospiraceae bacterium]
MKSAPWLEKLISFIIHKHKMIEKVFMVLVFASILAILVVGINYDLSKYLPENSQSSQGIDIIEDEFGYPGSAQLMIEDVSLYEAKDYKDKIEKIPGVDEVAWADTMGQIYVGEDFIEAQDFDDYYKDRCALMNISFVNGDSDTITYEALHQIKQVVGEKGYLSGPSVDNESLGTTINDEIPRIMVFVVITILLILFLTTTSWIEPILFMSTMFIGIILNMGSNIIFGEISFLSFSIAAVLQLAVSMDYSIFLLHSYTEETLKGLDIEEALTNALRKAFSSIVSSGMTTFIGFIALALMQFTIGKDMGFVLAKGIVCSMLTVLILMPSFILRMNKLIQKTKHKSFIVSLDKPAKAIYKVRFIIAILVAIIIVPCFVSQNMNKFLYGTAAMSGGPGSKTYEDQEKIKAVFGESNSVLILIPNTNSVREKRMADKIENLDFVKSVTSLAATLPAGIPESFLPESMTSKLHSEKYSRMIVTLETDTESDYAFSCSDHLKKTVNEYYSENTYFIGTTPVTQDMKASIVSDYNKVNIISILGVALVIFMAFLSPMVTLVIIIPIEFAVFVNMSIPYIQGKEMAFLGFLMVSSMQLGATVDYSILMTTNYMHIREKEKDKSKAAVKAIEKSMLSILTSGIVLTVVGIGIKYMITIAAIGDMGLLIGRGAIFSMIFVLGLLPFLLVISDKTIMRDRRFIEHLLRTIHIKKEAKRMHKKIAWKQIWKMKEWKGEDIEDGELEDKKIENEGIEDEKEQKNE